MEQNEDVLPRVPLPTVEQSCARFLDWCAPLLTTEQLRETETAVAEFRGAPEAVDAQARLAEYEQSPGVQSWLDEFWEFRYLGRRDRIALNANFFFLFEDSGQRQLPRAATLLHRALRYRQRILDGKLAQAGNRGQPESMAQYGFLFGTTRIPGEGQDTARPPGPARHIVVFVRGHAFRVDVLDEQGLPYAEAELAAVLDTVLEATVGRGAGVGALTSAARAEWAGDRQALLELGNTPALETVETALLCLCLEDEQPGDTHGSCAQLLHGDPGNRWFDKALSLIVFPDGTAGVNVEHCRLDGTTMLHLVDAILGTDEDQDGTDQDSTGEPGYAPISFTLDEALRARIAETAAAFTEYAGQTATELLAIDDFGAEDAKALGVSPDAFVQLAYQLAHQRAKGFLGATYESIATRQYRNGRTEAMRVVTPELHRFVTLMEDPAASAAERIAAARDAARAHVARAKQCQAGAAPEQHLWELSRRGAEGLALYDSPGWRIMRSDYLSTSSAPSRHIQYFGFGSTSPQCIGIAYVLLPSRFHVHLCTPEAVREPMQVFARELSGAIAELRSLLG
ncbi:choline/carnitine O-acyltransferase [Sciscionella sediminilitoris]|uniref:choline/carnitine O-acyltransferase n=1 Tax=Sciscionella sediminilitoris TaxID=1445613 RepID=UPI001E5EEA05|nr:choline/carnitine O-acyltransferase [Sciscionella sp. SE31]